MLVLLKVTTEAEVTGVTFESSDSLWKYLKFACAGKHCNTSVFCDCTCCHVHVLKYQSSKQLKSLKCVA